MIKSQRTLGFLLFLAIFGLALASYPQFSEPSLVDVDEDLSRLTKAVTHNVYDNIPEPQLIEVDEDLTNFGEGRTLATATYSNLRIYPIYSRLDDATVEFQNYMKNDLVPPILDYFQGALKVKAPIATKLSFKSSVTTLCGLPTPPELYTGVAADIAYFFTINPMEDSSTVASSYACFLAAGTSRPIVATAYFNTVIFKATTDVLLHEKNTYMLMHEITHALGFATSLYKYFLDADGNRLSGHIKNGTLDGGATTSIVLDVEPLTSKIRSFFGCPTIEGAYMENGGSSGTAGTHFEKRQFIFEAMTSPLVYQQSYSEFTLALLEGTGWYVPDYSYADPYWFGQGEGCGFLTDDCPNTNYDEWCSGTSRGCTVQGRGAGTCSADIRSDSCRYQYPNVNYDCENPNAENYGRYTSIQYFGRDQGSKCFTGTLSETSTSDSSTTFCLKYQCVGSGLSTTLRVYLGEKYYTCKYKGIYRPSGYKGYFDCPDPLTFCSTVGAPTCPRGCMGRGTCVGGTCQCNTGFTGKDCGLNA